MQGGDADSAIPGYHSSNTLTDLEDHVRCRYQRAVIMRVYIDKPGRNEPALGTDSAMCFYLTQISNFSNPIRLNYDVGAIGRRAGSINNGTALNNDFSVH